jgi:hypothetical protein
MAKKMTSLPGFKFVLQQSFVKSNYNSRNPAHGLDWVLVSKPVSGVGITSVSSAARQKRR